MSEHGTRTRYQYGCRCAECRTAKAAAERKYRAECGADSLVSAERAIEHLRSLDQSSLLIARLTGLRSTTIDLIPKRKQILRSTEQRILSVTKEMIERHFEVARKGFIPVEPVRELLKDLQVSGFSMIELARKAGLKSHIRIRGKYLQAGKARRIEQMYRKTGAAA